MSSPLTAAGNRGDQKTAPTRTSTTAALGQPASRALRSNGSAEPQLAAATDTSSDGSGAPLADFRAWRFQGTVDAIPTPGPCSLSAEKLGTVSATESFRQRGPVSFRRARWTTGPKSNPLKSRFHSSLVRDWSQRSWPKTRDICPCDGMVRERRSRHEYAIAKTIYPRGDSFSSGWISSIPRLPKPRCVRPVRSVLFRGSHVRAAGENKGTQLPVPCSGDHSRTCPDHVRVGDHRDSSLR